MAGENNTKTILNNTLLFIIRLLNQHTIKNWILGYGTLLGMVRENSCINGDDDVDIIIDNTTYDTIKKILIDNNFEIEYGYGINTSRKILKTKPTNEYCSIDFYMATITNNGDFVDPWEKVIWSKCYNDENKLIQHEWNGEKLYLPNNYIQKLINRYGEDWKIPQNSKGPQPPKNIL